MIGDSPGEQAYRQRARAWLEASLPSHWRPDNPDFTPPSAVEQTAWEKGLYEAGLAGVAWPSAYGGHGLTVHDYLIANEEIGRIAVPETLNSVGKELAGPLLLALGSEAQKHRFLRPILEMREIWCQGFSEPESGSDLAGLKTRATPDGGGWRIDGQKIWTSYADRADWCLLLARTGPPEQKHRSLTLFTVPMRSPGITVRPIRQITGQPEFCEVFFDGLRLDSGSTVGAVNAGWQAAVGVLEVERATNRMYRAGRFGNEFRHLVGVCRGEPNLRALIEDGHYRQKLAATYIDIQTITRHVRAAVAVLMAGGTIGGQGSLIKLLWSETHQSFAELALELLDRAPRPGGTKIIRARQRFEEVYLLSRAETVLAGTSQIQRDIIADRILRLPRER